MHLLNSARQLINCIPVVHEVAAVIAAEYHNAIKAAGSTPEGTGKAFALVTAGPGLTNTITGLAGAWLESRELLLIGGQVKVEDLAPTGLRQLGIQEINGIELTAPICKQSVCIKEPLSADTLLQIVEDGKMGRPGPVFLEIPLDIQASHVPDNWIKQGEEVQKQEDEAISAEIYGELAMNLATQIKEAKRPVLLLGGGLSHQTAKGLTKKLSELQLPIMTTWNGADRYSSDNDNYAGRPNTWGQRSSNVLIQQTDLLVAMGTRLGIQQTGFNWKSFVPMGNIIQIDIDSAELEKEPMTTQSVKADANRMLKSLLSQSLGEHREWLEFCKSVRNILPLSEGSNKTPKGYLNPYDMVEDLSGLCEPGDHIVPCSSGGAFTVMMQSFNLKSNQTMITNKGLASMGYGLSGAIGCAIADPLRRTVLVEGDGGFTQNLQELATVAANNLNIKMFLFCNNGYASIRMTQKNYFEGEYLGCCNESGLGFPDWKILASAYNITSHELTEKWTEDEKFITLWKSKKPTLFLVPIHPEQTYYPKITSRVQPDGGMESNPLHLMSPELPKEIGSKVMRYRIGSSDQ